MHVYEKAVKSKVGEVFVATCDEQIALEVKKNKGNFIMTNISHKNGTERVCEASKKLKLEQDDYVINVQGDEPMINSYDIKISQSGYLPTVGLVGSYGWNLNKSPATAFFPGTNNTTYSLGVGASLSWNLFDGGRTKIRTKNAKLSFENQILDTLWKCS